MIITKNAVLQRISAEEICNYYFTLAGGSFRLNHKIINPFRKDKNPDCMFHYTSNNELYFTDFARPEYSGDCFKVAEHYLSSKGIDNFKDVLKAIDNDFKLNIVTKSFSLSSKSLSKVVGNENLPNNELDDDYNEFEARNDLPFDPDYNLPFPTINNLKKERERNEKYEYSYNDVRRIFNIKKGSLKNSHIKYFNQFGLSINFLNNNNVFGIDEFVFGHPNKPKVWKHTIANPLIGYKIKDYTTKNGVLQIKNKIYYQVYRPKFKSKRDRFRTNAKGSPLMLMDKITPRSNNKYVFITSSFKDTLFFRNMNYQAVAPIGEGTSISNDDMEYLLKTFDNVIINYDNDEAGKKASNIIRKKFKNLFDFIVPERNNCKDISDIAKLEGVDAAQNLIKKYFAK